MTFYELLLIPFARDLIEIAGFAVAEGAIGFALVRFLESKMRVRRPLA
ncbi:MAG: hypothetical protein AAGK37_08600 [Pseudomonadota bacterium]